MARRIYFGIDDEDQYLGDNAEGAEILDQFINDEAPEEDEEQSDYDEDFDETVKKSKKSGRNSQKSARSTRSKRH